MKCFLKSYDKSLQSTFLGEDFQVVNNAQDHYSLPLDYIEMKAVPTVGSFMYFYDNYYRMISVKVDKVIYTAGGANIYCSYATLHDIDSYIFTPEGKISKDLVAEIKECHDKNYNAFLGVVVDTMAKYGSVSSINCFATEIMEKIKLYDRSVIDHTNLMYIVCTVLAKYYPAEFGKWHRPYIWEYENV